MEGKLLIVRKIRISDLMDALNDLYEKGIEFIDLNATLNTTQDSLYLSFSKEYMDPEYRDAFEEMKSDSDTIVKGKLSDEDLNQII